MAVQAQVACENQILAVYVICSVTSRLRAPISGSQVRSQSHLKVLADKMTCVCDAGTVEERILDLQERKRNIISAAFGEGVGGSQQATRLTKEDLHFLFTGQS